jgi:predicted GNAT superfamily acetyltransferase
MFLLPEYRNRGLAYQLKLAQRDAAMEQAIRLVTWTFDPLMAPNAHLNIRKLGAICPRFRENYYGTTGAGGLGVLGTSDRLFVEWWVTHRRVKERVTGDRGGLGLQQYLDANVPILNPTTASTVGTPWPAETVTGASGSMALLEIPLDYTAIVNSDSILAQAWQMHIRERLNTLMAADYVITDFVRETVEGRDRVFYLLSHSGTVSGFDQNAS